MIANGNTYCRVITPILLPEYQEVEYIQSSGTQYIDTGISCNNDTGIEADIQQVSYNTNNWSVWIGSLKTTSDGYWIHLGQASRDRGLRFSWGVGSGTFVYTSISSSDFNRHIYQIDKGELTIDNTTTYTLTNSYEFTTSPSTIVLFADKKGSTITEYSSIKIFYCKLYDNNVLIRNLIPCYRKSDNEIGMYDTVNGVFYTNQGTGTFLKGNNVVHTIKYKIPTEERPYISGHVTDGSSTFTFTVNGNESITVPVDSNGDWKWVADRKITSLNQAFNTKLNISEVTLNSLKDVTDMTQIFRAGSAETTLTKVEFKNCDFSKVTSLNSAFNNRRGLVSVKGIDSSKFELNTNLIYAFIYCYKLQFPKNFKWSNIVTNKISDMRYAFADCRTIINESTYYGGTIDCSNATPTKLDCAYMNCFVDKIILPIITSTCTVATAFDGALRLVDIEAQSISTSLGFGKCSRLNKQSIINLVNAAAANVTYTLHSTVYNKCASGGEWYTDIQAAINAKAQQGYTVTLISA